MISDKMYEAINKQCSREYFSAYLYLQMAAWCDNANYPGFAHWLKIQSQEEIAHGQIFYNFLVDQDRMPKLDSFDAPRADYKSLRDIFVAALDHERNVVTKNIHLIVDLAIDERDHATKNFLDWFVKEQVEEEANPKKIIDELDLAGDTRPSLFILDREKATRIFAMPAPLVGEAGPGAGA